MTNLEWVAAGVGLLLWIVAMIFYYSLLRYLTAGTRAFERYLDMTEDPVGRPAPLVPPTARHAQQRGVTSWGGS